MSWIEPENFQNILSALAPGFIILLIRRQFSVHDQQTIQDRIFAYAVVSTLYFATFSPVLAIAEQHTPLSKPIRDITLFVVVPVLIGIGWSILATKDRLHKIWGLLGLRPIHHTPSSWDYLFGQIGADAWIVVTLKNGMQIAGKYGSGSFSSTNSSERDLLISEVWELEDDDWTVPKAKKKILLCGNDIQTIEVFTANEERGSDVETLK